MGEFAIAKSQYIFDAIADSQRSFPGAKTETSSGTQNSAFQLADASKQCFEGSRGGDAFLASSAECSLEAPANALQKGKLFSAAGPAPVPTGSGCILDDPDLLWAEDGEWTEEQQKESETRLQMQGNGLGEFWRNKYIKETGVYWHEFYKRNADHFYKDRHYLHVVFPELGCDSAEQIRLLEVGCGVGNAIFPLMDLNKRLYVSAIDHARSAIQILRENAASRGMADRLFSDTCNIITQPLPVSAASQDIVLCMFVLSAVAPEFHNSVIAKLTEALKPGGKLLIRDYGRHDEAQLRFSKTAKLSENFYVRQDGTCSYFFTEDELQSLAAAAGLEVEECYAIRRQYANRQQKKMRRRVWMHAKLRKPMPAPVPSSV